MKKKLFLALIFSGVLFNLNVFGIDIYVSNSGNDVSGNGTLINPYQTLNRAQLAVRAYKANSRRASDINVIIRGGTYYLSSTLQFGAEDSGVSGYKVRYIAYNNETVVISGGVKIPTGLGLWTPDINGIWKVNLSSLNPSNVVFRQLWVDGNKASRSHSGIEITTFPSTGTDRSLYFNTTSLNGIVLSNATHKSDIEIWTHLQWMRNIIKIESIIGSKITTNIETPFWISGSVDSRQRITQIENAYEFVNESGEWFYDKYTKYLYYYPLNNTNPNNSEIIFPVLEKIISATNLSNVEFNGLTFSHATWASWINDHGYSSGQGSIYLKPVGQHNSALSNVEFNGCSNITVKKSFFKHLGSEAICFQYASRNNTIENNTFIDVAGTGIRIGNGYDYEVQNTQYATQYNIITNNTISNVANEYWAHCGIWLGFVNHNQVTYNKLLNLPYTGISSGYPYNAANPPALLGDNTFDNNEITDVMKSLRDGAAIYNHAPNTGQSYIRHNKICDIPADGQEKTGIYLDEGSSNFWVSDNYGNVGWQQVTDGYGASNVSIHFFVPQMSIWCENNNFDGCSNHWINNEKYAPKYSTAAENIGDLGVRFADVNHDGLEDMVYYRWLSSTNIQRGVYLNECGKWGNLLVNSPYCLPYHLYVDGMGDMGVQFVDFDNDGYKDIIYSRYGYTDQCKAFRNTGTGWAYMPNYNSPVPMYADGIGDLGVRFLDVNASIQHRMTFLNNGNGWTQTSNPAYLIPNGIFFSSDGIGDLGVQIVDLNGDNKEDLIYWRVDCEKGALINHGNNSGTGWSLDPNFTPKSPIFQDGKGLLGVKFIDVDHNGFVDMVYNRKSFPIIINGITIISTIIDKAAWLNTGTTWVAGNPDYAPVIPTYIDNFGKDQGVLTVDLNGDGYKDILQGYWRNTRPIWEYNHSNSNLSSQAYLNGSSNFNCVPTLKSKEETSKIDSNIINSNIANNENFNIELYPNPFKDNFSIFLDVNSNNKIQISLYSIMGEFIKTIADKNFEKGSYTIDVNIPLKSGVYFISAKSDNTIQYKKIIKK